MESRWLISVVAGVSLACGTATSGGGAGEGGAPGEVWEVRPSCDELQAAASAEDASRTPREDESLEQLAIAMDGGIIASQARYERLWADVAAIREQAPDLPALGFVPGDGGRELTLTVEREAHGAMADGTYVAWDCLNERYRARSELARPPADADSPWYFATIELGGAFNLDLVAQDYAGLPGVTMVSPPIVMPWSNLCAWDIPSGAIRYALLFGSGDCPSGCTELLAHGFESSAPGSIAELGAWDSTMTDEPAPAWLEVPAYCL